MNLEQAQDILEEIIDICYEIDHPVLHELIEPIYRDILSATKLSEVIASSAELQVHIQELNLLPDEEETMQDVHERIEKLSE